MGTMYYGGRLARYRAGIGAALVGATALASLAGALLLRAPETATVAPPAPARAAITAERTSLDLEMTSFDQSRSGAPLVVVASLPIDQARTSLDLEMGLGPGRRDAAPHGPSGWETGSAYLGPERDAFLSR
jgi:hypothetical protein